MLFSDYPVLPLLLMERLSLFRQFDFTCAPVWLGLYFLERLGQETSVGVIATDVV